MIETRSKTKTLTFALALIGLFIARAPSYAASYQEAHALFDTGDYDGATKMASSLDSAQGYALAARSLLGKINLQTREERSLKDIEKAIALSQKALELEPDHVEGHLQLASSYGIKGRQVSMFRAQMAGLPEKARAHLTRGIELDPDNGWCWAFIGAWHLEIVRKGGEGVARTLYGATTEEGIKAFDHSLTVDAKNPTLPFQYALVLLTMDPFANEARGAELLKQTIAIPVSDHQDRATVAHAQELLSAVEKNDIKETMRLLADYQGLKPLPVPRRRT